MTHKELVQFGAKWLKWHKDNIRIPNCKIITKELVAATGTGETPDILGFSYYASVNIEVKVSRADFLRDQKKRHKRLSVGMGNMKLYLCPEGLIKVEELPDGWGLLYCNAAGKISIVKIPEKREADLDSERTMLMSIIRRMKNSSESPNAFDVYLVEKAEMNLFDGNGVEYSAVGYVTDKTEALQIVSSGGKIASYKSLGASYNQFRVKKIEPFSK